MKTLTTNRDFYIRPEAIAHFYPEIDAVVYTADSNLSAVAFAGKSDKPSFHYRFTSEASRASYIANWVAIQIEKRNAKTARQQEKQALKAQPNPFKVGDIVYNSWGYEQTNIDYYAVVEVKAKSVVLQALNADIQPTGNMSGKITPVPGSEHGQRITKLVQWCGGWDREATPYLKMSSGTARLWYGKPQYCSWYA